jgi:hypothetical protein
VSINKENKTIVDILFELALGYRKHTDEICERLDKLNQKNNELQEEYSRLVVILSKEANKNYEKELKANGHIRVKPNLPKPKKTNFEKITENEESLADVLVEYDFEFDEYKVYGTYDCCDNREEAIKLQIEWLQKECE